MGAGMGASDIVTMNFRRVGAAGAAALLFAIATPAAATGQARAVMTVTATVVPSCHAAAERVACTEATTVSTSAAEAPKQADGTKAEAQAHLREGTRYLTISY